MQSKVETKEKLHTRDIVFCALFATLVAVGAFIKVMIPIGPFAVTFSLQFFFALMAGYLLGARKGLISVSVYLLIGLIGFPVFAHGGGLSYLLRPTFGFLLGFASAAFLAGFLTERREKKSVPVMIFAGLVGELSYYGLGLLYYYVMFNFVLTNGMTISLTELLVVWCFSTFLPDFLLVLLAVFVSARLLPGLRQLRGGE